MQQRVIAVTVVFGVSMVAAIYVAPMLADDGDGVKLIPIESGSKKPTSIKPYMQAKMINTQQVLEGLLKRDFKRIEKAAETLKMTSLVAPKVESKDETEDKVFEHFQIEFMRLAARLEQLAADRNLEGAAFAYQNLTATCISCHDHIRDGLQTGNSK